MENLICVCGRHHRAAHRGKLTIDRSEDGALRVRHADGSEYGRSVKPQALDVRAKVFSALRNLGFREAQVRAALEQLQREPALAQASFAGLLREALGHLHLSVRRR
jgi:Holliday junction resolvasome RuvABC DNA-binding subunit